MKTKRLLNYKWRVFRWLDKLIIWKPIELFVYLFLHQVDHSWRGDGSCCVSSLVRDVGGLIVVRASLVAGSIVRWLVNRYRYRFRHWYWNGYFLFVDDGLSLLKKSARGKRQECEEEQWWRQTGHLRNGNWKGEWDGEEVLLSLEEKNGAQFLHDSHLTSSRLSFWVGDDGEDDECDESEGDEECEWLHCGERERKVQVAGEEERGDDTRIKRQEWMMIQWE